MAISSQSDRRQQQALHRTLWLLMYEANSINKYHSSCLVICFRFSSIDIKAIFYVLQTSDFILQDSPTADISSKIVIGSFSLLKRYFLQYDYIKYVSSGTVLSYYVVLRIIKIK